MRKIFRNRKILILSIFIIIIGFLLSGCNSYYSSDEYKELENWVSNNYQKIDVDDLEDFSDLEILDKDLEGKEIVLTGEIHGTKMNKKLEMKLIRYLKEKINFKYYISEDSYSSAYYLNKYLDSGDKKILDFVFKNLDNTFAATEDRYNFWIDLYEFNNKLPEEDKIKVLGIDIEHKNNIAFKYLNDIMPKKDIPDKIKSGINIIKENKEIDHIALLVEKRKHDKYYEEIKIDSLIKNIEKNEDQYKEFLGEDYIGFKHVIDNIANANTAYSGEEDDWNKIRDNFMYENFVNMDKELESGKYFGQLGFNHVFLEEYSDIDWFASKLNSKDSKYKDKILSIVYNYGDSSVNIPGKKKPKKLHMESGLIKANEDIDNNVNLYRIIEEDSPFADEYMDGDKENSKTIDTFQYIICIKDSEESKKLDFDEE